MVIDITGLSSNQATQSRGKVSEQPATGNKTTENTATASKPASSVNISDTAQAIQKTIDNSSADDGINSDRVAELKAAIEDGSYQVDALSTAKGIFQIESQLG
ncbi:flagellar biosynthesis anti-sigma factor FlgM [Aliamphritea ceti]|uniref:flagellar biosynthesis anti-sigma factor FlgM n=1 Tax=Aliamphritea ceti TaxID=1524258 RepID=UPI0021C4244C|nr:flagellar biosynthesis anti-sigma factor FlgM [Aliamphritea ceti]